MARELPQQNWKFTPIVALCGALLLAGGLFLLIPLTQLLAQQDPEIITYRETVTISPPPPPPAPPTPEIEPELEEPITPPELQTEIQELSIAQLDLSLNPGMGDAVAMGVGMQGFKVQVDAIANIEKIFTFSDLPEAPKVISTPNNITFPKELIRRGIKRGKVVVLIEIDEKGKVRVLNIVSSTHTKLEAIARRTAERSRFTIPKVNGVPQKVRGEWPLSLQAPR